MTSLTQQLSTLKDKQRALPVGPNQQQPTLLLNKHQATTTSSDIFYTMAVLSFAKLAKEQPSLKIEGETLMSADNRDIARNLLQKDQNRILS